MERQIEAERRLVRLVDRGVGAETHKRVVQAE